jgi:hypothetical protein
MTNLRLNDIRHRTDFRSGLVNNASLLRSMIERNSSVRAERTSFG